MHHSRIICLLIAPRRDRLQVEHPLLLALPFGSLMFLLVKGGGGAEERGGEEGLADIRVCPQDLGHAKVGEEEGHVE